MKPGKAFLVYFFSSVKNLKLNENLKFELNETFFVTLTNSNNVDNVYTLTINCVQIWMQTTFCYCFVEENTAAKLNISGSVWIYIYTDSHPKLMTFIVHRQSIQRESV